MPRAFTKREREYIKGRLIAEAQECLSLYGIRKTTVDDLVKRANIAKGTFYLFFESKEMLFYEVLCAVHHQLEAELMEELESLSEDITAERLTELFFGLYKKIEGSFLYRLITSGELELLLRKLPPQIARAHAKDDDLSIEQLMVMIPGIRRDNSEVLSAALRAIFLSLLHKREISEEAFDDALRLLIRGVVMQMFEEV